MDVKDVRAAVGTIVTNLQSLELACRLLLSETVGPRDPDLHLDRLKRGDIVAEGPFTNYDSLGDVIRQVNSHLASRGHSEQLDVSLVELRDAVAHGRVFALDAGGPYALVKFARPRDGKVVVESVIEFTEDRVKVEVKRSGDEILKVVTIARELGLGCFPP